MRRVSVIIRWPSRISLGYDLFGYDLYWRKGVEAWKHLNVTHIAVDTMRAGFATPQDHIDAIRSFREIL